MSAFTFIGTATRAGSRVHRLACVGARVQPSGATRPYRCTRKALRPALFAAPGIQRKLKESLLGARHRIVPTRFVEPPRQLAIVMLVKDRLEVKLKTLVCKG